MSGNKYVKKELVNLELILFIANQLGQVDLHKLCKLFYFADKLHLSRYGRLILNEDYKKFPYGPVPMDIYTYLKLVEDFDGNSPDMEISSVQRGEGKKPYSVVKARRQAKLDYLSQSEQECLCETIEVYGKKKFKELSDESHDTAWHSVKLGETIPTLAIVDTLDNAEEVRDHLLD